MGHIQHVRWQLVPLLPLWPLQGDTASAPCLWQLCPLRVGPVCPESPR